MANRILRDWTDSENVDKLSCGAEIFFTRLFMKADDFGSFYSNPKLLRSNLYPLRTHLITDEEIMGWVKECKELGLIMLYSVENKYFLRIENFGQRLRKMKGKFPHPEGSLSIGGEVRPETETRNKKQKLESETETNIPPENEFLDYCKIQLNEKYLFYEFSLKNKYKSWVENGWKDGNDSKIKNWKTKILNTIPYLKSTENGKQQITNDRQQRLDEVSNLNKLAGSVLEGFANKNGDRSV